MTDRAPLGQSVPSGPAAPVESGIYLMDGIAGLHSLPQHSVDLLLTDPPYGTTRNFWDVPLPLSELWRRYAGRSSRKGRSCSSLNAPMIRCWGHPT